MFMECGSGMLDFPRILRACQASGVKSYIVEQDHCPGSPLDSAAKSAQYLRTL
jgi:sugar phosphate isomerase/epimerase